MTPFEIKYPKLKPNKDKSLFRRFDSVYQYADYQANMPTQFKCNYYGGGQEAALKKLITGDTTYVPAAERILEQMTLNNIFTEGLPLPVNSVVGNSVNIPAMLSGHPKTMRRRIRGEMSAVNSPMNIYVEVVPGANYTAAQMAVRGTAILAFAMAMSAIRPIELYAISSGRTGNDRDGAQGSIVKIDTSPLNLPQACFLLTSEGFSRALGFSSIYCEKGVNDLTIGWEWSLLPHMPAYKEKMMRACNMNHDDVLITAVHNYINEFDRLAFSNPVEWVRKMIEKHYVLQDVA